MWAWRVACALAVCAAAPLGPDTAPPPSAPPDSATAHADCDTLLLKNTPPLPQNVREHEAAVVQLARAFAELVTSGSADELRAAALARAAARAPLSPPPAAVALGAPHLHLGVLYLADADKLYVFQQNNSQSLQHFWVTLASAWNVSSCVWSRAWGARGGRGACGPGAAAGWWSGAAAARGERPTRAAAALFRRHAALPCEPSMHHWLGGAPVCDNITTLCEALTASSASSTHTLTYRCRCRDDHWTAASITDTTNQRAANEWVYGEQLAIRGPLECSPCALAAGLECLTDTMRAIMLAANLFGVSICVLAATIIFRRRKCKLIAASMWTVLEMIVFGAFLMYASAASSFLSSPLWRCLAGPWLRELGFIACYGSVVLRLWVLLAEFRTRKAHRWTPRDTEVLKIVCAMLLGAVCYLSAFTAMSICSNLEEDETSCAHAHWHDVTAAAEILLILVGLRIGYATRNANVPFQEQWWAMGALTLEGVAGAAWRVAARWGGGAAPEREALAAAARAQLSAAGPLACVLATRLYFALCHHEVSRCSQSEGFMSVTASVYGGGGCEEEPSVEEARAELRRLYAALEALRGRALRRDNPHVSRRRGGRKPPHRRFSLQALQARRGGKGKSGNSTVEPSDVGESRTPEDSVCSIEGPSHYTDGD